MRHVDEAIISDEMALNYHLMHPGGDSAPGDPNVAFHLDGTYHLHYILGHPWRDGRSFSFVHVTSPDMLHWEWQTTKLQPAFTGHGMFSGTGFVTPDGRPAAIYCGVSCPPHTFLALATDRALSSWEKPYPVIPRGGPDGRDVTLRYDPDGFVVGDTYYAYSAEEGLPLCKSTDLENWSYVGPLLSRDLPEVALGEDLSCANLYPFHGRWMLLCISHSMGCRYYIGDWDADAEQFVPESHGRMNWRRAGQSLTDPAYRDFFAPESVLTPDGRRVMWAWLTTVHPELEQKTLQSLPRELSLADDGSLRLEPLRELESLRYEPVVLEDLVVGVRGEDGATAARTTHLADIDGDSFEIRLRVDRSEADRKRFGLVLFAGGDGDGLPIVLRPESGTLCVGDAEAPFAVADLPPGEDLDLRIYADKYLVEVFANGRQAALTAHMDYRKGTALQAYVFPGIFQGEHNQTAIRRLDIWKLKSTNQGFFEARESRIWAPDTE